MLRPRPGERRPGAIAAAAPRGLRRDRRPGSAWPSTWRQLQDLEASARARRLATSTRAKDPRPQLRRARAIESRSAERESRALPSEGARAVSDSANKRAENAPLSAAPMGSLRRPRSARPLPTRVARASRIGAGGVARCWCAQNQDPVGERRVFDKRGPILRPRAGRDASLSPAPGRWRATRARGTGQKISRVERTRAGIRSTLTFRLARPAPWCDRCSCSSRPAPRSSRRSRKNMRCGRRPGPGTSCRTSRPALRSSTSARPATSTRGRRDPE